MVVANHRLPEGAVSKLSLTKQLGFNLRHLHTLLGAGVLSPLGHGVSMESMGRLKEGPHYVVCRACGARQAAITSKHLKACSGLTLSLYAEKYPESPLASTLTDDCRAKSPSQRRAQSETLRARFKTLEGEATRQQIALSSRGMQASEYGSRAAQHLRNLNADPEQRAARGAESKARWQDPAFKAKMREVHREQRPLLVASAARARGHLTKTFTKPHRALEAALLEAGAQGMVREHLVGHFRVDEAFPSVMLAVEVDGCYWHGCADCGFPGVVGTQTTDKRKTTYLLNRGWRVLRVPEHRIRDALAAVVAEILEACHG